MGRLAPPTHFGRRRETRYRRTPVRAPARLTSGSAAPVDGPFRAEHVVDDSRRGAGANRQRRSRVVVNVAADERSPRAAADGRWQPASLR